LHNFNYSYKYAAEERIVALDQWQCRMQHDFSPDDKNCLYYLLLWKRPLSEGFIELPFVEVHVKMSEMHA
jgi:hypothetical protein